MNWSEARMVARKPQLGDYCNKKRNDEAQTVMVLGATGKGLPEKYAGAGEAD